MSPTPPRRIAVERAPLQPAIHLAPARGWMNDPNGLCHVDGTWHACFQHDPATDTHGVMHWGHATSTDLVHWTELPIALAPDELGVVYSGSVVVDHDDTAGFGRGAMVAVFTHHLDGLERQSLAYSGDGGTSWRKYDGNPVLESSERDFRDPKVRRHVHDGRAEWIMTLAVGRRIEFYRSSDLRSWERTCSYAAPVTAGGVRECPDLLSIGSADGRETWLLVFGVIDGGPRGHSGTFVVPGRFDGATFEPSGEPSLLDHGPDFYAAQSFWGAPGDDCVLMAWMNSWRYATNHPSRGRRGVMSLPRRIEVRSVEGASVVHTVPYADLVSIGARVDGSAWTSRPGRALHVRAQGEVEVMLATDAEQVARLRIAGGEMSLERFKQVAVDHAQTYTAPVASDAGHEIVIDHGTIEAFAAGGATTMSALVFPGTAWHVHVDGAATLTVIS